MPGPSTPAAATRRDALHAQLIRTYSQTFADRLFRQWFDDSGFANFGYWHGNERAVTAAEQLVDKLIERIPPQHRRGEVLDVGCGAGGTTLRLTRHFAAEQITAINIGVDQLERAAGRVPQARFLRMDAAQLEFPDAAFDHVICVEAAHHFHTRARFLVEAFRVLRPGGYLVLADVLFTLGGSASRHLRHALLRQICQKEAAAFPPENLVQNLDAYSELLWLAGFRDVSIENALAQTWKPFYRNYRRFLGRELIARPRSLPLVLGRLGLFAMWDCTITAYPLVCARKPAPGDQPAP